MELPTVEEINGAFGECCLDSYEAVRVSDNRPQIRFKLIDTKDVVRPKTFYREYVDVLREQFGLQVDCFRYWGDNENHVDDWVVWVSERDDSDRELSLKNEKEFREYCQLVADGELPTWKTALLQKAVDESMKP